MDKIRTVKLLTIVPFVHADRAIPVIRSADATEVSFSLIHETGLIFRYATNVRYFFV